jgi:hypothetical protein
MIDLPTLEKVLSNSALPSSVEQIDNLIRLIGNNTVPGHQEIFHHVEHGAIIGSVGDKGFNFVLRSAEQLTWIDYRRVKDSVIVGLTLDGWKRFYKLQSIGALSNRAFLAMQYGDNDLDKVIDQYFKTAVKDTGFSLNRLDENRKAGLIDDKMRVDIRASRFMIADLSHGNQGAYWEAGFAEGLGKPVIYTCSKKVFDDKDRKPHFDTNHHLTVIWDEYDMSSFVENLKATIRATIPESIMEDASR